MSQNLGALEQLLGHRFQNPELLRRAVTHRSWAYENAPAEATALADGGSSGSGGDSAIRAMQNESLEFVGDAVLGLAVVEHLFNKHPNASEGELTLMKHRLVSTATLAAAAQRINLGDFMRVGRGEEKTGGRRKQALLADTLEAVIAAIFFDGGYVAARAFVQRLLAGEIRKATPTTSIDYKTQLQEILQADKREAPVYSVVKTSGPPHNRVFHVEAVWDGGAVRGKGTSIKQAEMMAANLVLKQLKKEKKTNAPQN
jgi:ribonuclease III